MIKLKSGFLIALEGIDGAGKTTQAHKLTGTLRELQFDAVYGHEPTYSEYGQKIRQNMREEKIISPQEENRLFIEDRKLHVSQEIIPQLNEKKILVTDRYFFANAAYQGARSIPYQDILKANREFAPEPDIVFLLDISADEALKRINNRKTLTNYYEKDENLKKVREKYLEIHENDSANIILIDGTKQIDAIAEILLENVIELINETDLKINGKHERTTSRIIRST